MLEFAEALRAEGMAVGTSELLDAFAVLGEIEWEDRAGFREGLAATLAKSQEDRRIFELIFERFFFRAPEAEAVRRGVREAPDGESAEGAELLDLEQLREAIAQAIRATATRVRCATSPGWPSQRSGARARAPA